MTYATLPDPVRQSEFYQGVPAKRAVAWVIDVVIIGAICVLALPFTAFTGVFFFPFLMLTLGFFYRWFTISGRSATWGMRMMAIELRDMNGQRFTSGDAFWHTLGYSVSVTMAPLQLVSAVLMGFSARGQGLTDHVMGSSAINRPLS